WVYAHGDLQALTELKRPFNAWLKEQYVATAALQVAWGVELLASEQIENATVMLPADLYVASRRLRDFVRFCISAETETAKKMSDCIRAMGFKGIIAPYNNGYGIQTILTRRNQQAAAMNTYHDPNDNMTGPILQTSSFEGA